MKFFNSVGNNIELKRKRDCLHKGHIWQMNDIKSVMESDGD